MNIKSFSDLVGDQIIALQSRARGLVDVSIGSILRSLAESNAGMVMWLQQLIVRLLVTTRASTCSGEDLDSWMADFGFFRHGATPAAGHVTFSRFTTAAQAVIPVAAQVKTQDGSQIFAVVADEVNANFSPQSDGYVMKADVGKLLVPVRAVHPGAAGNALAGMITVISGVIPFVDTVTNTEPMTGGLDAENDAAFRARFVEWIGSLARGTRSAIEYALSTVPGCRSWILTENLTWEGVQKPGYFFAVVDDGTGHPPQTFLDSVSLAIEGYRAFTITYGVFRPNLRNITVSLAVLLADNSHKQSVLRLIEAALRQYVAALRIGQPLSYTQLIRVAYAASPEVANVTSLYIDGDVGDIYVSPVELIILRTLQVE